MKKQNRQGLLPLLLGILPIVTGVLIFVMTRSISSVFTMVLAAGDIIFGVVLVAMGIRDLTSPPQPEDYYDDDFTEDGTYEAAVAVQDTDTEDAFDDGFAEADDDFADDDFGDDMEIVGGFDDFDEDLSSEETPSVQSLTEREIRLRSEVKEAGEEARIAAEDAARAKAVSDAAEAQLAEAQQYVKVVFGAEQQDALRQVDVLARQAKQASDDAAVAARKAEIARRAAEQKKAEHRQAMADAAAAMAEMDDDFDDDF